MPRNRRTDIEFEVFTEVLPNRVVSIVLSLMNNSPNDYYISETVLLLGEYASHVPAFTILGPSKIICSHMLMSTSHENFATQLIFLPKEEKISHTMLISDFCSFKHCASGVYTIRFNGYSDLFQSSNISEISGEYTWLIGNSSFIIGETRDTTVSESVSHDGSL